MRSKTNFRVSFFLKKAKLLKSGEASVSMRITVDGDELLMSKILEVHPKLHLFGHTHARHGIAKKRGITFSNGAMMNSDYSNLSHPSLLTI